MLPLALFMAALQVVTAWNGQAISAYALASRILPAEQPPPPPCFPVEGCSPETYLQAAIAAAGFVKAQLWDESKGRLRRAFCKAPSAVEGEQRYVALKKGCGGLSKQHEHVLVVRSSGCAAGFC
jgi:hypothetical protein